MASKAEHQRRMIFQEGAALDHSFNQKRLKNFREGDKKLHGKSKKLLRAARRAMQKDSAILDLAENLDTPL